MSLNFPKMDFIQVKIILIFVLALNLQTVISVDTTTSETTEPTTDSNTIQTTLTSIVTASSVSTDQTSSNQPTIIASTILPPPISINQKSFVYPLSITVPLLETNLHLNISAHENRLEFTVVLKNDLGVKDKSVFGIPISDAKRFFLAFENDHFNIDIIALNLINDSNGNVEFGSQIEDLTWNKKNGVLLPDSVQDYKWVASGAVKNGSQLFATFTRPWATCDIQDIQFSLGHLKIWWFLETHENLPTLYNKGQIKKDSMRVEKLRAKVKRQTEEEDSTATSETPEESGQDSSSKRPNIDTTDNVAPTVSSSSSATTFIASTAATMDESTLEISSSSTSTTTKAYNNDATNSNRTVPSRPSAEEVEVLKSIEEYNFQGPINVSISHLLENSTWTFLKVCGDSGPVFRCNTSEHKYFESSNTSHGLFIWKVVNSWNSTIKASEEYPTEPCRSAVNYIPTSNIGNKKTFNALSGSRTPKAKSHTANKNSGRMTNPSAFRLFDIIVINLATIFSLTLT